MATKKKKKGTTIRRKRRGMGAAGSGNNPLIMFITSGIAAVGSMYAMKKIKEGITDAAKLAKFNDNLKMIYGGMAAAGGAGLYFLKNPWLKGISSGIGIAGALGFAVKEEWIAIGDMDEVPLIAAYRTAQRQLSGQNGNASPSISGSGGRDRYASPFVAGMGAGVLNQRRGR